MGLHLGVWGPGLNQETTGRELLKVGKNRIHGGAFVKSCVALRPVVAQKTSHPEMTQTVSQRETQRREIKKQNKKKKQLLHSVSRLLAAAAATHR